MKLNQIYPVIWMGLIVFASLVSGNDLPHIQLFKHADKLVHWGMYFGFSILTIPPFLKEKRYLKSYVVSVAISIFTGLLMEFLQYSITNTRSADIYDFLANCIGSFSGILFYQSVIRNKKIEKLLFRIE